MQGDLFFCGDYKTLTVEIYGSSSTRTIDFVSTLFSGNPIPLWGVKVSDGTTANTTTGNNEAWQFDIQGLENVYFDLTAVDGGDVTITGRASR